MKLRISASKLQLASHCLHWAGPDAQWPPYDSSDAAEIGTWYHAVCAWYLDGQEGEQPPPPECMGEACELTPIEDAKEFLASLPEGATAKTEVAYVYSRDNTRHVGFNVGRKYGRLAEGELPGSADVVVLLDDRAIVVDWKSGQRVDRANDNLQLALLALCVAQYHKLDEIEVQLRYGDGYVDSYTYDVFSLADVKDRIDAILSSEDLAPKPGLHCTAKYCPLRASCPKTVEVIPDGQSLVLSQDAKITGPDHAASLWHRAHMAQELVDSVIKAVKTYVDERGAIDLGSGKELAIVDETRESIEASTIDAVYAPVSQWLAPEEFAKCIGVSVPKGALEKQIKAKAARGQKEDMWNAAMDSLRSGGVVKSKTIARHRVRSKK